MMVFNFKKRTLGSRIYLSMIALIVVSLLITGVSTHYFFKNQNDVYHLGRLHRKEQSVMLSLKYFVIQNDIKEVNLKMNNKLDELANIHGLDFNLYNEFGGLVYSTIENEGKEFLAPKSISSSIVDSVSNSLAPIIVEEKLEDQNYLSTYFMLQNELGKPIAVVHIPYHKDSKRSKEELNAFLDTLIQVFMLLFVGASLVAFFLSNYITKSLQAVSEGIKKTQLKGENQHIEWKSNDEIGELVRVYNSMVDELQESADMLAKSERQSAWKEMARQVAHEIKNPLTPMRLNIQHLQRSINDDPAQVQERVDRFTKGMLEQIDTLSRIASEFSNFAKMPRPEMADLNLPDALNAVVELYINTPNVTVKLVNELDNEINIRADRKQLIRALSNLVKNGIQAISHGNDGEIVIRLFEVNGLLNVSVSDNGKGIPEGEQGKIFEPYFTTKSGGTGLGLALVKNIFHEFNAEINFETQENIGTTFTITFHSVS